MLINLEPRFRPRHRPHAQVCFGFRALLGILVCLLATLISAPGLLAQNNPPVSELSSNRFLIIVDTSTSMKRMAPDIIKIIAEIIKSSASGQLRTGDSLGLWTFNEEVFSELPAQNWSFPQREKIGDRIIDFLKHRRLEKSSRLDQVMPDLLDIVKASDIITVIIISNGEGKMKGTPFDAEINAQYQQNLKEMGSQREPIVTVLQAKGGRFSKFTMNVFPWPVVIPELPLPIKVPQAAQAQPAPVTNEPPAATVPPLIISKSAPSVVTTDSAPPVTPTVPVKAPAAPNFPVPPPPPTSAPPPLVIPKTAPPVVTPDQSSPATVTTPRPSPPVQTAPSTTGNPVQLVTVPPPSVARSNPPLHQPDGNPASVSPMPAKLAAPGSNPVQLAMSKPPTAPAPGQAQPPPAVTPSEPSATNSTAPLAVVSTEIAGRPKSLLIAVVGLVLVALLLTALIIRRHVAASGPSLITRSMGNKKK